MNKNLNKAKQLLQEGASLVIVNGGGVLTYNKHGVDTLLSLQSGSLTGSFVADKVVGKAAAMLLVRGGAIEVYAEVISEPALAMLKKHRVICLYGTLVPNIINRDNTGICPMEQAVLNVDSVEDAYEILIKKTGGER